MIHIDDIKFDFSAVDETFARNLYVRWDVFYRDALRSVIEDFLSRHDEEGVLVKFEQLELNLGDIPQDDFYRQFPIRLREELERNFTYSIRQNGIQESRSEQIARRLFNLMFYIDKGFCPTMWEYAEFDMEKELQFLLLNDPGSLAHLLHSIIRYPHYLNRLAWSIPVDLLGKLLLVWLEEESLPQAEKEMRLMELEKENGLLKTYLRRATGSLPGLSEKMSVLMSDDKGEDFMVWLLNTTLSMYEKRRSLVILLETRPHIVIGFIHETQDEKAIRSLAKLLDKVMIRQIIDAECENHTEIDVPAYWVHLYSWLVDYYPFNGVYQFGNKLQFKDYLNVKLLQFIKKRPYSAYLSKTELTLQFLIEVFGSEYYLDVLNIIYSQQARNTDGSPVYTGYFNMELYYMFLRLSLIKFPAHEEKVLTRDDCSDTIQWKDLCLEDVRFLMEWLANSDVSEVEKRNFMALVAEGYLLSQPDSVEWLSRFVKQESEYFIRIALLDWLNDTTMDHDLKRRILQQHLIWHPERVFHLVWESIRNNKLHPEDWAKWLDGSDWVRLVGSYSLYKAELLEQILEYLSENNLIKETQLPVVLANYLTRRNPVLIMQEKDSEMVSQLVQSIQQSANGDGVSQENSPVVELVRNVMSELQINDAKSGLIQGAFPEEPENIPVSNAGLALLAPWFPRLFDMCGLLNEERNDFKDSESRVRAIYILQRLVTFEEKEFQEKELAFNRILVNLPFTEPLPPKMELTEGEIGVVESMLEGVKANWEKMNNSSVRGLQHNFIVRNGYMVQQEKKWTLTVESRSYDMLLDTVPWSYNIISLPWLKKPIYVSWREKEEF